ncbi:four helix bundle protein [Aquirufa ecclesiirivi]|uniref:four helix bundle protein n=1 Tax=Aquirufa ecclesiirivi TaxID=2715124 RepID=UPI0022A83532|nr:four helix bundle protein [Aquirufa ecclesiirivi]MCZ2472804.1 four helix bundle protein [Aquirufa ecclesiirivi]
MKNNILKFKTFEFAKSIISVCKAIQESNREYTLTNQLLKSGTSVGAMIREAQHAESKADFIHKLSIAQKEINETIYWLELLESINLHVEPTVFAEAKSIYYLITRILKTLKER